MQDDRGRHQDIGEMVREVHACISGQAGAPRDRARFRELHHPLARSLRTVVEDDGRTHAAIFDDEGYIDDVTPRFASMDFHRRSSIERFGQVARCGAATGHATPDSPVLPKRGANSIQLCEEQGRCWVFSTVWDNERQGVAFDPW